MHVALRCPCGASLKAPVKYVGRELKCPKCAAMLVVPEPPVASTSQPAELEVLEPLEMPAAAAPVQPVAQPVVAQPITAMPVGAAPAAVAAKPKKVKKKSSLLPYLLGVGALAIAGAGAYLVYEYKKALPEKDKVQVAGVDGQTLTKAELDQMAEAAKTPPAPEPWIPNSFDSGVADMSGNSENLIEEDLDYEDLVKLVDPSIVRIFVEDFTGEKKIGSGFFVDKEGKIFTNYHVIEGAVKVTVETVDGKKADAVGYLAANSKRDLAIIQVDPDDFECVPIAIAKELPAKGSEIAAFGSPQGFSFSNSNGKLSSIRTTDEISDIMAQGNFSRGFAQDMSWIQHSAAISGGNSGGPLVNYKGQCIGVNTWTHSQGQNLNFASTMDELHKVFEGRKKGEMRNFSPRANPPAMGR